MNAPVVVVVGLGYTGLRLARALRAHGTEVVGTTRDPEKARTLRDEGLDARVVDLEDAGALAALAVPGAAWVHTAPPVGPDPARDAGIRATAAAALGATPRCLVYLSTTGVYRESSGGLVDEGAEVDTASARAAPRLDAEKVLLEAAREASATGVVFRPAAIYGPGRGLASRVAEGRVRLWGGGHNLLNRIHVDDLVQLILAALEAPPEAGGIYNAADERPASLREQAFWLADRLGLPRPAEAPAEEAPSPTLLGSRRVDGRRARRVFGVQLRYPSFVEGFEADPRVAGSPGSAP